MPSTVESDAVVRRCFDVGNEWFDTAYLSERVLLGACLQRLHASAQARVGVFRPWLGAGHRDKPLDAHWRTIVRRRANSA